MKQSHQKFLLRKIFLFTVPLLALVLASCPNSLLGELVDELNNNYGQNDYTLTIVADSGGSVDPAGPNTLKSGVELDINATPDSGQQFVRWQKTGGAGTVGIGNINAASTTVSVSGGDATVTAFFGNQIHSLTLHAGTGGSITTPSASPANVANGVPTTIVATPDPGYEFDHWEKLSGSGSVSFGNPSNAATTATLTGGNAAIRANFTLRTYALSVVVDDPSNGSIQNPGSSPVSVTHGVPRNIRASNPSKRGYHFAGWTQVAGSGTATFTNASSRFATVTVTGGNVTVQANYEPITASLEYKGFYDLDGPSSTPDRMNDPKDLVYDNGFVYVAGNYNSSPKVLKIDVSSPTGPSLSGSTSMASGTDAFEIIKDGSSLYIAVDGYGIRRIPISNFSSDNGWISVSNITNLADGQWYSQGDEIHTYQVQTQASLQPDSNLSDIYYDQGTGYLYASGGNIGGGSISVIDYDSGSDSIHHVGDSPYLDLDPYIDEMTTNGDVYLYGVAGTDGLRTWYIDDDPISEVAVYGANSSTIGNNLVSLAAAGNYLITAGLRSGTDRLAVFDIHSTNGSEESPYFLSWRYTSSSSHEIKEVIASGDYIYTLEGTRLVVYYLNSNAD